MSAETHKMRSSEPYRWRRDLEVSKASRPVGLEHRLEKRLVEVRLEKQRSDHRGPGCPGKETGGYSKYKGKPGEGSCWRARCALTCISKRSSKWGSGESVKSGLGPLSERSPSTQFPINVS